MKPSLISEVSFSWVEARSRQSGCEVEFGRVYECKARPKKAMVMIQEAKRLDTKGMLKNDIKQVEAMIKNPRVVQRARR